MSNKLFTNAVAVKITSENIQTTEKPTVLFEAFPVVLAPNGKDVHVVDDVKPAYSKRIDMQKEIRYIEEVDEDLTVLKAYKPENINETIVVLTNKRGHSNNLFPLLPPEQGWLANLTSVVVSEVRSKNLLLKVWDSNRFENFEDAELSEPVVIYGDSQN